MTAPDMTIIPTMTTASEEEPATPPIVNNVMSDNNTTTMINPPDMTIDMTVSSPSPEEPMTASSGPMCQPCPEVTSPAPETTTSCPTPAPDVDYCSENPCDNGGTCVNTTGTYHCDCAKNWMGQNCTEGMLFKV